MHRRDDAPDAKDACATEALKIATYTSIERLARSVGDEQTAKLAAIRADVGAEIEGDPSYDVTNTGAADAAGATGKAAARLTLRGLGA